MGERKGDFGLEWLRGEIDRRGDVGSEGDLLRDRPLGEMVDAIMDKSLG